MTYNIPELTLIGAATNLVLQDSGQPKEAGPAGECSSLSAADELPDALYDLRDNW